MKFPLEDRLTDDEAAAYLGKMPGTLRNWRIAGKGPKFYRIGAHVFYMVDDLDQWIIEQSGEQAEDRPGHSSRLNP